MAAAGDDCEGQVSSLARRWIGLAERAAADFESATDTWFEVRAPVSRMALLAAWIAGWTTLLGLEDANGQAD